MARRRNLRLPSSSDEDEEAPNLQTPNPNPSPCTDPNPDPSSPPPSPPLEISDDENAHFYDVPDDFSGPSPPDPNPNPNTNPNPDSNPNVDPIEELLQGLGLRLRREWLESCVSELERSGWGFERLDINGKAKLCFEQFLLADMNYCGVGILPANVGGMHQVELEGPFVLQSFEEAKSCDGIVLHYGVDEIVNICTPLRERYHNAAAGYKRCLKLSLTDGIQRVFGMEYRPIKDLDVGPSGLKIIVRDVQIRRGLLILVPEVLEVFGGVVEDLEAARKRLVHEIDKPPRGKRRRGSDPVPLAKRASFAAWPSATADNGARQTPILMPESSDDPQSTAQATANASSRNIAEASAIEGFDDPVTVGNSRVDLDAQSIDEITVQEFIKEEPPLSRREVASATYSSREITEASTVEEYDNPVAGSITATELTTRGTEESTVNGFVSHVPRNVLEEPTTSSRLEINPDTVIQASPLVGDIDDVKDEVEEVEHPLILSGDRETPFTYLASLFAKWATQEDHTPSVQGKIKCTLTGVKGFQFKHRRTYELHVYVDDGSLISEVIIDHHVVEKGIGHSPEEVTAALSSSDKQIVTDMKETMKRFQLFLTKFEGIITVEINENSSFPVALEMNQGCSTSDAWMLLRRLKKFTVPRKPPQNHLSPIDLSP